MVFQRRAATEKTWTFGAKRCKREKNIAALKRL
jgi:hypothetical protein